MLARNGAYSLEMQENQHFVESLIALRDHYQAINDEYERFLAHAKEQLTHVNALLVNHLGENQPFVESLIGLRDHYQGLLKEYSSSSAHAREQLTHVNALLVDQLVLPHNQQRVSMQALTVTPLQHNHSLLGGRGESVSSLGEAVGGEKHPITEPPSEEDAADIKSDESRKQQLRPDYDEEPDLTDSTSGADQQDSPDSTNELDLVDSTDDLTPTQMSSSEPEQKESPSVNESGSYLRQFPTLKTSMLPRYQHLTKTQAVEKLLQDNVGTILHVDYIIRALYGELDADAIRAEKPRMYDTLSKGTSKGLWDKVPDQASCYTIDLKLVDPELASKKITQQSKAGFRRKPQSIGRSSNKMLPPYQQLNLVDAVEVIIREHPGEILNTDKVARGLYGELSGLALSKAKERVGKALWSGAKQKRWQRIPGQTGLYTLDLKLVAP